jgi:glutaredoxin
MAMADVIIYTLRTCATSKRAMADLDAEGVSYEERKVDENAAYYEEALELAFTVPIIVRDGRVEVGWKGESG